MINCIQINSTSAALLGAVIGGVIGIIGTLITTWATFERETKSFKRTISQKSIDEIISAYSFALNVFFNLKRGGNPDLTTLGDAYAQISLYGSDEVKNILNKIVALSADKRQDIDTDEIITAMQRHIKQMQNNLK